MDLDPQVAPYRTSDKNSFAHVSAVDRWPKIITGAIDDVHRSVAICTDAAAATEGKGIVEALAKIKYELQHNRQLTPLDDDGEEDVHLYNDELRKRGNPVWHDVSWLYSECYLYRRMNTLFARSQHWKGYDVFARQKLDTFKSSQRAVIELASRYKDLIEQVKRGAPESMTAQEAVNAESLLFNEMAEACLWGNATDLSLLTTLTFEDLQKLQDSKLRKAAESTVLVNDLPKAFDALKQSQKVDPNGERRVDFVLDNAGFELYADLVFAGYLLASGLATTIVLRPKSIPWFVSDVVPNDFGALLNALSNPKHFFETMSDEEKSMGRNVAPLSEKDIASLNYVFNDWSQLHASGKLVIRPHRFWTHAGSFWRMPTTAPALYADLRRSELIILKGDLNGRKLTGDVMWDPTTPFPVAIGPLARTGEGLRLLQLRTCKADTVVGLKPGEDERLKNTEGGGGIGGARKWAWSGKWAVVQYNDALYEGSSCL
ncbi:MAG: hypothetical protein Q9162_006066 [Coniocarpon cinnabarinum]